MNKIYSLFILTLFIVSCGSSGDDGETSEVDESKFYPSDGPKMSSAKLLKEKLGGIYDSFSAMAQKELEESVCPDSRKINYHTDNEHMDVLLMTNYMMANFSGDTAAYNYAMPDKSLANGVPLSDFGWLNFNTSIDCNFDLYRDNPGLEKVPRAYEDENGDQQSYKKQAEDPEVLLKACQNSLVGVVAIVDYEPPIYTSDEESETGYIMGYVLFANWDEASVNCMIPFLTTNRDSIDFSGSDGVGEGEKTAGTVIMENDLHEATYESIAAIVKKRTKFKGVVHVNKAEHIEEWRK